MTKRCPVCGKYPNKESYSFKGQMVFLYSCPSDHVTPDELHCDEDMAVTEWNRCVEAEEENDA